MDENRAKRPSRASHRLPIYLGIGIALSAILVCGGIVAIIGAVKFTNAQQRTPQGAIVEYFDALQFRDTERLGDVLCSGQSADAQIKQLYDRLAEANFKLQTLSWVPNTEIPDSDERHIVNGVADLSARRGDKSFDVKINYQITVEKKFLSWYVCDAKQVS